jgi:hypothetical protein
VPALGVLREVLGDGLEHELHLGVVGGGGVGHGAGLLELDLSLVTLCVFGRREGGWTKRVSRRFGDARAISREPLFT